MDDPHDMYTMGREWGWRWGPLWEVVDLEHWISLRGWELKKINQPPPDVPLSEDDHG
jgi:hypothetical protein